MLLLEATAAVGASAYNGSLKHFNAYNSEDLEDLCPWLDKDYCCDQDNRPPYRLTDGSCNLLSVPWLGAAMTPFRQG